MQRRFIPALLAMALFVSCLLSILTIHGLQGSARVINNTGIVQWAELKAEILAVRQGSDGTRLYDLSEGFFTLADRAVYSAVVYAGQQVRHAEIILLILGTVALLPACTLAFLQFRSGY